MDKTESLRQARQRLSDYVRINSLRYTQERETLLDAIYLTEAPFSAEAMSKQMSEKRRMRVSRATVYNNLGLFERAGLVRKVYINEQVLFERTDRNVGVIRLQCSNCNKVTEMNDDRVRHQISEMRTRRFTMTGWSLSVYGLCSSCMAVLKRKQKKLMNKDKEKNENRKD